MAYFNVCWYWIKPWCPNDRYLVVDVVGAGRRWADCVNRFMRIDSIAHTHSSQSDREVEMITSLTYC